MRITLRNLGTSLALAFAIFCTPAVAQDGRVIIDILQDQLKQYLDREQQKNSQQEAYKRFQASWNSCFSTEDLVSCDDALRFPGLTEPDRQKLNARRTTLAAQQEERVRREQQTKREQDEVARSFRSAWDACFSQGDLAQCDQALAFIGVDDQDRQSLTRQRAALLAQREEEAKAKARENAEAQRRIDLERQRLEAERKREAESQRQAQQQEAERRTREAQAAEARQFVVSMEGCMKYVVAECDKALAYNLIGERDRLKVVGRRTEAAEFQSNRQACQAGNGTACNAALSSVVAGPQDRKDLEKWLSDTSLPHKIAYVLKEGAVGIVSAVARWFSAEPDHSWTNAPSWRWINAPSWLWIAAIGASLLGLIVVVARSRKSNPATSIPDDVDVSAPAVLRVPDRENIGQQKPAGFLALAGQLIGAAADRLRYEVRRIGAWWRGSQANRAEFLARVKQFVEGAADRLLSEARRIAAWWSRTQANRAAAQAELEAQRREEARALQEQQDILDRQKEEARRAAYDAAWSPARKLFQRGADDAPGRLNIKSNDQLARFYADKYTAEIFRSIWETAVTSRFTGLDGEEQRLFSLAESGDPGALQTLVDHCLNYVHATKLELLMNGEMTDWDRRITGGETV